MKQVDDASTQPAEPLATELAPAQQVLSPEAWDRRGSDQQSGKALNCLEHAARYLIFDQMQSERTFVPGARDAVHLLWDAMLTVEQDRITRERIERLSSVWLPQQILARTRGIGPPAH